MAWDLARTKRPGFSKNQLTGNHTVKTNVYYRGYWVTHLSKQKSLSVLHPRTIISEVIFDKRLNVSDWGAEAGQLWGWNPTRVRGYSQCAGQSWLQPYCDWIHFFKLGFEAQYPPMTGKTKRVSPVGPDSEHKLANKRRGVTLRCNTANAVSKT